MALVVRRRRRTGPSNPWRFLGVGQERGHVHVRQFVRFGVRASGSVHTVALPMAGGALPAQDRHNPPTGTDAKRWSATQQTSDFRPDAGPCAVSELSRQPPVEAGVQSLPFGNRQHDLAVRHRCGDFLGHVQCGQQSAFLTGKRDRCSAACRSRPQTSRDGSRTQRTRAKPSARSPQARKAVTLWSITGRQKPYLA